MSNGPLRSASLRISSHLDARLSTKLQRLTVSPSIGIESASKLKPAPTSSSFLKNATPCILRRICSTLMPSSSSFGSKRNRKELCL